MTTDLHIAEDDSVAVNVQPRLSERDGILFPAAPVEISETALPRSVFSDLCLKFAHTVPRCTSRWVSSQVMLPLPVTEDLLMELAQDHLLEVLGMVEAMNPALHDSFLPAPTEPKVAGKRGRPSKTKVD